MAPVNQICAFLFERGIPLREGLRALTKTLKTNRDQRKI
ncbi:hypothetical protein Q669_30745 [Labrenzia sp. C1B10]|nr:hypothetical protein Q669_30745 [Labrenzia sp. C1B10]ERS02924.1 hypothetical protein Q675_31765 [Labrenzia sp. C1B70]